MKFGRLPSAKGEGAILAHAIKRPGLAFRKGERLDADHIEKLLAAGVESVIAACLEPDDVHEDEAAWLLASRLAGNHVRMEAPFTGRCNLFSATAGLTVVPRETIDAVNAVDEAVTIATLRPLQPVEAGEMVATVKIIPFAVPGDILGQALDAASGVIGVAPFRPLRIGVISTLLPGLKPAAVVKTLQNLEARLAPAGARISADERIPHDARVLTDVIPSVAARSDLVVIFGASAITDRRDVVPSAIIEAGGAVHHLGMPVDPGNLLLLGELRDAMPIIGAPGCARSPRENGFDFVLWRILAGLPVKGADLRAMGVGGLLNEIRTRPQPRNPANGKGDDDGPG